ncbi:MAG: hypothetical protein ACE10G_10945, partial [Gemmatimonadales bacterium]
MNNCQSNPICGPPRRGPFVYLLVLLVVLALTPGLLAQWVEFEDQTAERSDAAEELFANDPEEKDYAWGDLDNDGDLDLAIARKQPFTTPGKRVNVLMMNQGGVLTDRTADFAVDTDIPGDQGFLTPTNDRDVTMVDVNQDGWLDVITSTAVPEAGDPKHIAYPRVYINKCCAVGGCDAESCSTDDWLGLRFEDARMPLMLTDNGQPGSNPSFCAVSAGDVTGDGYPDLYFSDYSGFLGDFNDKLLINQGLENPGFFEDMTETNFIGACGDGAPCTQNDTCQVGVCTGTDDFPVTLFGAASGIAKFNQDEHNDIVREQSNEVRIAYNMPTNLGTFDKDSSPDVGSTYFINFGDLNNDVKLDLTETEDGFDRFLLNQGDDGNGMADFISYSYSYSHSGTGGPSSDSGFGGNNTVADLNNDGHQ